MPDGGWGALARWTGWFVLIAMAGTWIARRYALRKRLLDLPGERRSHHVATPRGGGIAIAVAMLLAITYQAMFDEDDARLLCAIALGLSTVAGIGWVDDHRPLPPWARLLAQAFASAVLGWAVIDAGGGVASGIAIALLALVLVNIWNFMDGIDGIAVSQCLLVASAYGWLANGDARWLAFALVGACLGFLPFNFPKARIFLGDVGSGALGYLLAALAGWILIEDPRPGRFLVLMLPLTAFAIDSALTLASRVVRHERWWLPHAQHAYQHWARRLGRHEPVTLAYGAWTFVMAACMLAASKLAVAFIILLLSVSTVGGAIAWSVLRSKQMDGSKETQ
jgi:UDP-N-acetylmuramyl pentapeptide phosphotransferase/UDP-N-acetylglucosamine-1-phosphate transferase